jgi:hypothetical protein
MFIYIPGRIVAALTFPGVILHELGHQLACRLLGIPVLAVCYFRFGRTPGFVEHETPPRAWQSVAIALGPFALNSAAALVVGASVAVPALLGVGDWLDILLLWLGLSFGTNAFPSMPDALAAHTAVLAPTAARWERLLGYPVALVMIVGAALALFGLSLAWGWITISLVPGLVVSYLRLT